MKIIKKIFNQLESKKIDKKQSIDNIGSFSLRLTSDSNIDILCSLPDITNKSNEEMLILAEEYAKFLLYITQPELIKNDILDFLSDKAEKTRDPEYKLLLDNILIFWEVFNNEYKKRKKNTIKDDLPLIRPISVFLNK